MKKRNHREFGMGISLLAVFALWTVAVGVIDVAAIGPEGSSVGFATLNRFVHKLTGVHMLWYTVTDWLGLVPVFVAMGFAILGLVQWIRRKDIRQVDFSILVLGGFYIAVIGAYMLFEKVVINYRPVLINGYLEASYPSSTTLLVLCIMPTAMMQFAQRLKQKWLKHCVSALITVFILFMVTGRLLSGVHWFTDIIGGILLSGGLVMLYRCVCHLEK